MKLQLALIISFLIHFGFILIFPIIESHRIIHVSLPIEIIPYTPPVEEQKVEKVAKPETIRTEKIKTRKEEKKEITQVKEETKKEEPKEIAAPLRGASAPAISIKTAEFPFTYYLSHIKKSVAENWYVKTHQGHYMTVVYFKIHRDGKISDVKIRKSSGDFSFDKLAITAIESAAPFLPLPDAYPEPSLGIYFEFQLKE